MRCLRGQDFIIFIFCRSFSMFFLFFLFHRHGFMPCAGGADRRTVPVRRRGTEAVEDAQSGKSGGHDGGLIVNSFKLNGFLSYLRCVSVFCMR